MATGGVCGGGRGRSRVLVPWRPAGTGGRCGGGSGGEGLPEGGNRKMMAGRERNRSGTGGLCRTHRKTSCVLSFALCGAPSARLLLSFSCTPQVGRVGIFSPMSPGLCVALTFSTTDLALPPPGRECQGRSPALGGEGHRVSCRNRPTKTPPGPALQMRR